MRKKCFGAQIWVKRAKIRPIFFFFFLIFKVYLIIFTLNLLKKKKKKKVPQFGPTLGRELGFMLFSQVWFFGFPLNYIG